MVRTDLRLTAFWFPTVSWRKNDAQAYYRGGEVAGGQLLARALRNGATRLRPAWPPGGGFPTA